MRPRYVQSAAAHHPDLMMITNNVRVTRQNLVAGHEFQSEPIHAAVGRTKVKHTCAVTVRVSVGLTAEDVDRVAYGHDIGAANFLSGFGDTNWTAPTDAIIGGLSKVQWLADRAHVARCGEQIN